MDNLTTHIVGTIFPIRNQHIMLNHQYNNIINSPTADIYPSSSSSTASNSIDIKEVNQINFQKRIQHQLCYPKHYRLLNFSSTPNYHRINNNSNEFEQKHNQSLFSQKIYHYHNQHSFCSLSIQNIHHTKNNHNHLTVEDDQNFTILNLNHNSQSLYPILIRRAVCQKLMNAFIYILNIKINSNS